MFCIESAASENSTADPLLRIPPHPIDIHNANANSNAISSTLQYSKAERLNLASRSRVASDSVIPYRNASRGSSSRALEQKKNTAASPPPFCPAFYAISRTCRVAKILTSTKVRKPPPAMKTYSHRMRYRKSRRRLVPHNQIITTPPAPAPS